MNGDFSRVTYRPGKHYSGVRMQQGRVQLDADWNEQLDISANRAAAEALDVIGGSGGPLSAAGFALALAPTDLPAAQQQAGAALFPLAAGDFVISAGRYYVGGIMCENDRPVAYTGQPDFPDAGLPPSPGLYLVYLDVWERHLTALEDPDIREVALGGPDTATRTKVVWQARLSRVADANATCTSVGLPPDGSGKLTARAQQASASTDPCLIEPSAGYRGLENQLYRVEVHAGGPLGAATFKWSRDNATIVASWLRKSGNELTVSSLGRDAALSFQGGDWVELTDDTRELRVGTPQEEMRPGTLVRLVSAQGQTLTIDPASTTGTVDRADFPLNPRVRRWNTGGETGTLPIAIPTTNDGWIDLEDGVQVKFEPGQYMAGDFWLIPARTATGSVEWPFADPQPPHGVRHRYARLGLLAFDGTTFTSRRDCRALFPAVTELMSVFAVGGDGQEAAPGQTLPQPLLVGVANGRWPVAGATVRFVVTAGKGILQRTVQAVQVTTAADGVASCIWTLDMETPGQQVTATLLDAGGAPVHLPVRFNASLSVTGLEPGIHVIAVASSDGKALANDSDIAVQLFAKGIRFLCDAELSPAGVSRATCYATVELPFPASDGDRQLWGQALVGHQPIVVAGNAVASGKAIMWAPTLDAGNWLTKNLFSNLIKLNLGDRVLVRLTLRGDFIWDARNAEVFLDGNVTGVSQVAGGITRTALRLPSGDGRRGGSLEMWCWLVASVSIAIEPPSTLLVVGNRLQEFVFKVIVEGTENTNVTLTLSGAANQNGSHGTVSPLITGSNEWRYIAPPGMRAGAAVTITAVSVADPTKVDTATVRFADLNFPVNPIDTIDPATTRRESDPGRPPSGGAGRDEPSSERQPSAGGAGKRQRSSSRRKKS